MSFATVADLNTHLATRSYVSGYSLSAADREAFLALDSFPDAATYPHVYRWALHVEALTGLRVVTKAAAPAPAAAAPATSASAKAEESFDMFGEAADEEETEEERAATKARQERIALAKKLKEEKEAAEGKVKKEKVKEAEKSLVVLEVKPWEADTDLEALWHKIIQFEKEGLTWGQTFKLEPVAFGIKKLVLTCTIVDALVLLDDITENIEAMEEFVQSVEIASMNKI